MADMVSGGALTEPPFVERRSLWFGTSIALSHVGSKRDGLSDPLTTASPYDAGNNSKDDSQRSNANQREYAPL